MRLIEAGTVFALLPSHHDANMRVIKLGPVYPTPSCRVIELGPIEIDNRKVWVALASTPQPTTPTDRDVMDF